MSEQPTNIELIDNVPGMKGEAYVPAHIIEVNPDQVAIAHELQRRRTEQLGQVSALAVRASELARSSAE